MHYHLEIILPPTENLESAISDILAPFDENGEDEDGERCSYAFWDFYVIGGRWAGAKLEAMLAGQRVEEFRSKLGEMGVTVSGLQCGKPTLSPSDQIPAVDALWNEFFPDSPTKVCPLFSHFNDQYADSTGFPDIMTLKDAPKTLRVSRVIVAGPSYGDTKLQAHHMVQDSMWNGVSHVDSKWDGNVFAVIDEYKNQLECATPEWSATHTPQDDWLMVTVDYHS